MVVTSRGTLSGKPLHREQSACMRPAPKTASCSVVERLASPGIRTGTHMQQAANVVVVTCCINGRRSVVETPASPGLRQGGSPSPGDGAKAFSQAARS